MATREWTFDLGGQEHTVRLNHAYWTGGIKLWVDGERVPGTPRFRFSVPGSVYQIPFMVVGSPALLEIQAGQTRYDFELVINNRPVLDKAYPGQQSSSANLVSAGNMNGQSKSPSSANPPGLTGEFIGRYEHSPKRYKVWLVIGIILILIGLVCLPQLIGTPMPAVDATRHFIDRAAGDAYNLLLWGTIIGLGLGTLIILWGIYKRFVVDYPTMVIFSDGFALEYSNRPSLLVFQWSQVERFDTGIVTARNPTAPFLKTSYIYYARLTLNNNRKIILNNGYRNISRLIGLLDQLLEEPMLKKAMVQLEARETLRFGHFNRYFLNEEGVGFGRDFFDWREIGGATLNQGKLIIMVRNPEQLGTVKYKEAALSELHNGLVFFHLIEKLSANYQKGRLLS